MNDAELSLSGHRLVLSGDVVPDNVVTIRRQGEKLISDAAGPVTANLSQLGAAHSVVLSLLLCWVRHAESQSKVLKFEAVGERLRALAALSGLDHQLAGFTPSGVPLQS